MKTDKRETCTNYNECKKYYGGCFDLACKPEQCSTYMEGKGEQHEPKRPRTGRM